MWTLNHVWELIFQDSAYFQVTGKGDEMTLNTAFPLLHGMLS